jgi:hypothetical protein
VIQRGRFLWSGLLRGFRTWTRSKEVERRGTEVKPGKLVSVAVVLEEERAYLEISTTQDTGATAYFSSIVVLSATYAIAALEQSESGPEVAWVGFLRAT